MLSPPSEKPSVLVKFWRLRAAFGLNESLEAGTSSKTLKFRGRVGLPVKKRIAFSKGRDKSVIFGYLQDLFAHPPGKHPEGVPALIV